MDDPRTDVNADVAVDHDQRIADIYRALKAGLGRELVDDRNVEPLIRCAARDGEVQLEALLREWRSPCGDDPDAPRLEPALPPPRGVGRAA